MSTWKGWPEEIWAFFILFPTKIIGFDLDFEQLTNSCNLRDERYALKSGIFISFLSALWALSLVPQKMTVGGLIDPRIPNI